MIRVLRAIRSRPASAGNPKRYLLYAAGEIVLIVIGILMALQINNANVARGDRARETKYLRNIRLDLQKDTESLRHNIDFREGRIASTSWIDHETCECREFTSRPIYRLTDLGRIKRMFADGKMAEQVGLVAADFAALLACQECENGCVVAVWTSEEFLGLHEELLETSQRVVARIDAELATRRARGGPGRPAPARAARRPGRGAGAAVDRPSVSRILRTMDRR